MANAIVSSTEVLGARLLREIAAEEGSLEELLHDLRVAHPSTHQLSRTNIPDIDDVMHTHGSRGLAITGRSLPLVYTLITSLLSGTTPATIALIDLTHRFSPSHLLPSLPKSELAHIHVFRPTATNLQVTLDSIESYMLYGDHASKAREWRATFFLGGSAMSGSKALGDERLLVSTGWRGWLRVEKEVVVGFGLGVSVEEAWDDREQRWTVIQEKGWKAVFNVRIFTFK